jgi:very-short-patch-repair endonuclease
LPATSAIRTVTDLGSRLPLVEAVVAVDMALHQRLVDLDELQAVAVGRPGGKGSARFRRAIELAESAAESPMETRLRMLLVQAGLPRPEAQVSIHDDRGRFLGRPDLLYREPALAIEYDGGTHRDRMVADDHRQNLLQGAGFRILRYTAADLYKAPDSVVRQVADALARKARYRS